MSEPTPTPSQAAEPSAPPRKRPRPTRRARVSLWLGMLTLVTLILLVGGAVLGVLWAAGSANGTAWLLGRMGEWQRWVTVIEPQGSLIGDFSAKQVVVRAGRTTVTVDNPRWTKLRASYTPYPSTLASLRADSLHASRVEVKLAPSTTPPSKEPARLPKHLRLPVEVHVPDVQVEELIVPGVDPVPMRQVRGAVYLGDGNGRHHRVESLRLVMENLAIQGRGQIDTLGDKSMSVSLTANQASQAGPAVDATLRLPAWAQALREDWSAQVHAAGPLARFATELTIQSKAQSLQADARIEPISPWPVAELELRAKQFDLSSLWPTMPMSALSGSLSLQPMAPRQGVNGGLHLRSELTNHKPGTWTASHIPVRKLKVDAKGRAWGGGPLDVNTLIAELSNGQQDAGVIDGTGHWDAVKWEADLRLRKVQPSAVDPSLPAITLSGPVHVKVGWTDASAPNKPKVPTFSANAELTGNLLDLGKAAKLSLTASGNEQRIELKQLEASAGGARASLVGQADRRAGGWQVQAQTSLVDFDPQPWFPGHPSPVWRQGPHRLNLKADTQLNLPEKFDTTHSAAQPLLHKLLAQVQGRAELEIAPSVMAGTPVSGSAKFQRATLQDALVSDASLDLGGNRLQATGRLDPRTDGASDRWTVKADAPAVARLAPILKLVPGIANTGFVDPLDGAASADATLTGRWPRLTVEGLAQVQSLRAGSLSIGKGDVRWRFGSEINDPLEVSARIDRAGWGQQELGTTVLQFDGTPREHKLNLVTELNAAPPAWTDDLPDRPAKKTGTAHRTAAVLIAHGELAGGFLEPSLGVPLRWKGMVDQLELRNAEPGERPWISTRDVAMEVHTGSAAKFVMAAGRADIFNAGLRWERIEWQPQQGVVSQQLNMQAELEPLAVAPLLSKAQPNFGWGGDLRIGGKVLIKQDQAFSADIVLQRVSGDLTVTDDGGTQPLGLTDLVLALNAQNGTWTFTQGLAGSQLGVAAGAIVVRTSPQRAWPAADAPLEGVFESQVENLGTWGSWVPTGWRLGGRIRTTVSLSGRIGAPEYTGQMIGNDISVRNILEGVNITDGEVDVSLRGASARINRFVARAGDGLIDLSGDASFGENPQARLKLKAERFQLLGRVDRRVVVSGQGEVTLDREDIDISGRFDVDEGLIDFTRSDAPSLGSDVVVANRTDQEPEAVDVPQRRRNVTIKLGVGLGDKLRIKGRGIDAGLVGELSVSTPNGLPSFTGNVRAVGGTYAAYNQKLTIDRGVITFNGPVNDPRLDIEATRPNLDVRVGVAISGNALNPRIRLFSDPDMSDMDKLSWLMLGRGSDGLGSSDTALLQQAAMALLAGDSPGVTDQVLKTFGLNDLSVRQTDGDTRDTVVTIGKQLSRRWYVGYERGLNATEGTWQLIYRIARRFTLRAQSGLDTSLDLIWTWRWD